MITSDIDKHLGRRVRDRRIRLNMLQDHLAAKIGCSPQMVSKYERADFRMSAETLYRISVALDVSAAYFFEGLTQEAAIA
jgi:transcriptional regulator with XRE-family HTH domain